MYLRIALSLACLGVAASCTSVEAPNNLLAVDYHFASLDSEAEAGNVSNDTDVYGFDVRYEFLPFGDNINVALSYISRSDEIDVPGDPSIDADILRAQLLWHWEITDGLNWHVGPGVGYAISVDGPAGTSYDETIYYDVEAGARWYFDEQFGLQGGVNYSVMSPDGANAATADTDLTGFTAFVGAFVDF